MCQSCGCTITPGNARLSLDQNGSARTVIQVLQELLAANDREAMHNREHFDEHGVLAINLMSSPGAGKTALLEATILALGDRYRIAVIEGDLETENDAARIRAHGVPALQITTAVSYTHLDVYKRQTFSPGPRAKLKRSIGSASLVLVLDRVLLLPVLTDATDAGGCGADHAAH